LANKSGKYKLQSDNSTTAVSATGDEKTREIRRSETITADYHIRYLFAFVAISVADGIKPAINIIHSY